MDAPHQRIERRLYRLVVTEDPIGFGRPDDLSAVRPPPEAACAAERLSFCQVGLPASKFPGQELALGHVHHRSEVAVDDAVFVNGGSGALQEEHLAVVSDDAVGKICL